MVRHAARAVVPDAPINEIGMEMASPYKLDNVTPVLQALEKKAKKYGDLGALISSLSTTMTCSLISVTF